MNYEYCDECGALTGRAGRHDDSIFIWYPDKEIGPLCEECREKHWVCDECGEGVYPEKVTYEERHEGCGGMCS